MMWKRILLIALLATAGNSCKQALADEETSVPARPQGAVLVPEQFLRAWDPVTVFFDQPQDVQPGVVLTPPETVSFEPDHPGVFQWLDRQTLQFRPADPWPPLARFDWQLGQHRQRLDTLMAAAHHSEPHNGATDLAPLDTITLYFRDPVALDALRRMIRIEVYRQPAVDAPPLRVLDHEAFSIQALERGARDNPAAYRLRLNEPVGEGREIRLQLRLSLNDDPKSAMQTLSFATRGPFRAVSFGCGDAQRSVATEGIRYPDDDALVCRSDHRTIDVQLSDEAEAIDPVLGRNLLRFEPRVENLEFRIAGERIRVSGDFQSDTLYRMSLHPADVTDVHGRILTLQASSSLAFHFPAPEHFLQINRGDGRVMMEMQGPQMLPLRGRGDGRVDLRIHAIDAEDLRFWPYVDSPVAIADDARPPGPGEEPAARDSLRMSADALAERIATLGTPSISEIIDLPLAGTSEVARFGLDLSSHLARINGAGRPGSYLVGLRRLGENDQRQWVRLQVTDLSLSVIEEESSVRFVVTSLATGEPLAGADVRVEAPPPRRSTESELLISKGQGRTDADGAWVWQPSPGRYDRAPERIMVRYGNDRLVLDVSDDAPPRFFRHHMGEANNWLSWTASPSAFKQRVEDEQWHCHLFTERPVYKPADKVHIAGFVRQVHRGELSQPSPPVHLLVRGPDGSEWRYPIALDDAGGFHHEFDEPTEASGDYAISLSVGQSNDRQQCASQSVEKTPYRLPRFEVRLDGPRRVAMDRPFDVGLDAEYYAGGMVNDRPVRWQVTQFPYRWMPKGREGFMFSSDGRYSDMGEFDARPTLARRGRTDDRGRAELSIDPTQEPSAQPRRYVFEATVVGDDDQTVTDTHDVLALPPFVLGVKAPRYLQQSDQLQAELIMVGPDDELIAGHEMQLRLIRRRWAARLQASDFSDGEPRYATEVVDETIAERRLDSAAEPVTVDLELEDTGVYLLEVTARDALGRAQTVQIDLFNDGESRATWPKPPAATFEVSSEAEEYAPGETARLILQSPLAEAHALVVVEQPDGSNEYHWLDVRDGRAVFELPIVRQHLPALPVHFLLLRGRLDQDRASGPDPQGVDLGKPVMMAASHVVSVSDDAHRVSVELDHPEESRPGESIDMDIRLSDASGKPLSGYVTLWLVDQAVLALGEEQRLDMLPDFLRTRPIRTAISDTRNRPVGYLPFLTEPGGDGALASREASSDQILAGLTIRERFESVPYFRHAIAVDASGHARVSITLPDDLTNFMIRAKAVAGPDRFGHKRSQVSVRLPVIVQPSLPRFVRYGDRVTLSATSRVVDGELGPGTAALQVRGLETLSEAVQPFEWPQSGSHRIDFPVRVPMPESWTDDPSEHPQARVTVGVERDSDGIGDGFAVDLAVLPDRQPIFSMQRHRLQPGEPLTLEGPDEAVREGSLQRSLLVSDKPEVLLMAAGLNQLMHFPHQCSEQRISRARAMLAARELLGVLYAERATESLDRRVKATLQYLDDAMTTDGSIGYWPGAASGNVAVTSWALHFMVEAEAAGFEIDDRVRQRLHDALQRGLRGGHEQYFSQYLERTMALTALAADGSLDSGYAAELARRSQFLGLESTAHVTQVLAMEADPGEAMLERLRDALWDGLVFQLRDGEPVYAGLKETASALSPMILPSETRTIARVLTAVQGLSGEVDRQRQLIDVLVQLGQGDGWGNTNANAEAILALSGSLQNVAQDRQAVRWQLDGQPDELAGDESLERLDLVRAGDVVISNPDEGAAALGLLHQLRYVPEASGEHSAAEAQGFVLDRELIHVTAKAERRLAINEPGSEFGFAVGDVVEDRLNLVNPEDRYHVAIVVPLAAGMELLNPSLQTAPPEAKPSRPISLEPSYMAWRDHEVAFYYNHLPAGTHEFAFRQRAQFPGRFTQPSARAELMYQPHVHGQSHGAAIVIKREE